MAVSEVLNIFEYHILSKQDSEKHVRDVLVSNIIQTRFSVVVSYVLGKLLVILALPQVILCLKGIQLKRQIQCKLEIAKCNSEI